MEKVISSTESEMLKDCNYIKEFHFNRLPKPFEVVTEKEYEWWEDTWYPQYIGIGQLHSEEQKSLLVDEETAKKVGMIELKYRFYSTRGYAKCKYREPIKEQSGAIRWEERTLFIRFGCEHKNAKLVEQDAFERKYRCPDCGLIWTEQTGY